MSHDSQTFINPDNGGDTYVLRADDVIKGLRAPLHSIMPFMSVLVLEAVDKQASRVLSATDKEAVVVSIGALGMVHRIILLAGGVCRLMLMHAATLINLQIQIAYGLFLLIGIPYTSRKR